MTDIYIFGKTHYILTTQHCFNAIMKHISARKKKGLNVFTLTVLDLYLDKKNKVSFVFFEDFY